MAWASSAARVAVVLGALAATAHACPELEVALATSRFAIAPGATDAVGLDLWTRSLSGAWGCGEVRHHVDGIEVESPDVGDQDHTFLRVAGYRAEVSAGGLTVELGAHLTTVWAGAPRFLTPMLAVRATPWPSVAVRAELVSAGVFVMARDPATPRRLTRDVAIAAAAVWPAAAATRGEVRLRARRYTAGAYDLRDVTLTAGVGLALAARRDLRALPGFVGLGVRVGDVPAVLVIAELGFGVAGP